MTAGVPCMWCGHYASEHNAPPSTACRVRYGAWSEIAPGLSTLQTGEVCGCPRYEASREAANA